MRSWSGRGLARGAQSARQLRRRGAVGVKVREDQRLRRREARPASQYQRGDDLAVEPPTGSQQQQGQGGLG